MASMSENVNGEAPRKRLTRQAYEVYVYRRAPNTALKEDLEKHPFQADILTETSDHHGVAATAHEALRLATQHWCEYAAKEENTRA